jgi:hypothetical protein
MLEIRCVIETGKCARFSEIWLRGEVFLFCPFLTLEMRFYLGTNENTGAEMTSPCLAEQGSIPGKSS